MKKKYVFLAALATMLAACNNNENVPTVDEMADTPVVVNADVADLTARAGHDAGELKTGSLGFYMTTAEAPSDNRYNAENREVKYEDSQWNIQGDKLLWRNETATVDYIAYHPYDMAVANNTAVVTTPTVQETSNVVDFLYVKGTTKGSESKNGIDLTLKHQMSKLNVTLRAGSELGTTPNFKDVTLKGVKGECEFDLATGAWKDFEATATTADVIMVKNSNNNHEAIIIPQTVSEFVVEVTTADDRKFIYKQNDVVLEPGMAYTLSLMVGKDKVELAANGVTVGEWKSSDTDNNLQSE